jgi:molecular chaperone GrpE
MPFRGRGEVIPIEVARQIHAEREQAVAQLQRAQQDSAMLRRLLDQREEEQRRLLQTARTLEAELVNARRAPAPAKNLPDLEASESRARAQRDAAVSECADLRARLEATTARLADLEAAQSTAEAQVGEVHEAQPDNGRVQELLADLANLRRRKEMDVAAGVRAEHVRLLGRLGDVRDSVAWALAAGPDPKSPWYAGLVGIRDQVDAQLRAEGATLFGEAGEAFDPRLHEAIGTAAGRPPDTIHHVEAPGIALDDGTIVRPARVVVTA